VSNENMASGYINYIADASTSVIGRNRGKWELSQKYVQYLDDTTEYALGLIFGPYQLNHFGCYVATRIFSSILTPGKKNGLMTPNEARGAIEDNLYCDVNLPTLFFNALVLLKFMQFGDDTFASPTAFKYIKRVQTSGSRGTIVNMKIIPFVSGLVTPETMLKGVKILCAIAALKPEVYEAVQEIYNDINKELLRNIMVNASELLDLRIESGKIAIPMFKLGAPGIPLELVLDDYKEFSLKLEELASRILEACNGSLEDFLQAIFALDIDNITTYKEENTMMVVTEILRNLINKGILITRDGRLLSINITDEDTVQVNPFNNNDAERPTIANLTIERNGTTEEIITLKDDRLEHIIDTAQNVLNSSVNNAINNDRNVRVQRASMASATPATPEMRRNADGSISVHRTVGSFRMWAPATPAEAAQFERTQQQQAQQDQLAAGEDTERDAIVETVEDSPEDIVMVSVVENNSVRVRRMTREEAEDQELAIVSVIERR
jgi:hypothetical protein